MAERVIETPVYPIDIPNILRGYAHPADISASWGRFIYEIQAGNQTHMVSSGA
jgi:hypothetical protein